MISRRALLQTLAASALLPGAARAAAPGRRVVTSPIALRGGRVWVSATIGGSGPHLFIIDTGGAISFIHERVARELGMRAGSRVQLMGVGGAETFQLYRANEVVFGGAVRQPVVLFGSAPRELGYGAGAAGTLATGLFTAVDSDLDFEKEEWRIYPDGRGEWDGFTELPSAIRASGGGSGSDFAFVDAVLDGREHRFLLDTGMPGQIMLWPGGTRRSGLWTDTGPYAPRRGQGIGGATALGRTVRAGRLAIGGLAFERPLVALSDPSRPRAGALADGIIGLELMERLNLSTDTRRRRLWAQANARPRRPERYALSGLWVDEQRGRLVVADVGRRSPAAEAGLRVGDEIVGVGLQALIGRLAGRPGQSIPLTLRRDGREIPVTLILREFL